jgi:WD40 repeat protein
MNLRIGFCSVVLSVGLLGKASENLLDKEEPIHQGLVSDIAMVDNQIYSLAPSGLSKGIGEDSEVILAPSIRLLGMGEVRWNDRSELILAGGEPGVSGVVGFYSFLEDEFHSEVVGEDLIYDVAVGAANDRIAIGCADGRVMLAQFDGANLSKFVVRYAHTASVRSVVFSDDGKYLASAGLDGLVLVASLDSAQEPVALQDHSDKVECVVFSPNSKSVVSGARDGRIRIHSVEGRLIRNYSNLGGIISGTPWERKNQILSLAYSTEPLALVAGTSLGYVIGLSLKDTSSEVIARTSNPVNSLLIGDGLFVGSDQVSTFPLDVHLFRQ